MKILWDQVGSRRYDTGCDRGVLYLPNGTAVPWNGLTSVEHDLSDTTVEESFLDGIKYLNRRVPGDFSATLKALTYPDEFLPFDGTLEIDDGFRAADQSVMSTFGLCYRTMVGTDLSAAAYKLHLLYNLTATPDNRAFVSIGANATPLEFSWKLNGVPVAAPGMRPSVHFIIDSTVVRSGGMAVFENQLYGTDLTIPVLPDIATLAALYAAV